jgi:hypothetical protein
MFRASCMAESHVLKMDGVMPKVLERVSRSACGK